MKERRDRERRQRDLHARGEEAEVAQLRFRPSMPTLDPPRAPERRHQKPEKQQQPRKPEIDGILEKRVVNR